MTRYVLMLYEKKFIMEDRPLNQHLNAYIFSTNCYILTFIMGLLMYVFIFVSTKREMGVDMGSELILFY